MHKTVLLNETIDGLLASRSFSEGGNLKGSPVVIDGTLGGGGHSMEICRRFPKAKIIGFDQDSEAIEAAREKLKDCNAIFFKENFRNLDRAGEERVDGIILDLGLSSLQLDDPRRGFSFKQNGPLHMKMDESGELTAKEIVNEWSEDSLEKIIRGYGEERYAGRIARGMVEEREKHPLETTDDLVKVIEKSVPGVYRRGKIHFATRTFQAIRIAVNDELNALEEALQKGFGMLNEGG